MLLRGAVAWLANEIEVDVELIQYKRRSSICVLATRSHGQLQWASRHNMLLSPNITVWRHAFLSETF